MTESNPYLQDIKRGLASLDLTVLDGHSILVTGATGLIGGCLVDVESRMILMLSSRFSAPPPSETTCGFLSFAISAMTAASISSKAT